MRRFSLLIIIIIALGGFLYYSAQTPSSRQPASDHLNIDDWVTYTNEQFGFSVRHPREWEVFEAEADPITPKFNIYKPGSETSELPYTHHSPDATHVSIFPQGIPTEGVFGEWQDSTVDFTVPVGDARDYTLSDDTVWATYARVTNAPEPWNESGFLFARVAIKDQTSDCLRDDEHISPEACDPLTGDQLIHHGSIDEDDRAIQEAILASFTFTENKEAPTKTVTLFYYDESRDQDAQGNIMCSESGLVAVKRSIPITRTPIQDTIRLLLQGELTPQEKAQGISTEYPLEGLELEEASLADGILTLGFRDPNGITSGGSCRAGILWSQITATARQFDNVEEVRFQPEELFQP